MDCIRALNPITRNLVVHPLISRTSILISLDVDVSGGSKWLVDCELGAVR